jgi:formate-dependent nitrite reductase membrane component NrfD
MLALFLDLSHKAYVWRLYLTLQPRSPMSWGAWILILVYPVLLAGVALDPPAALRDRVPALARLVRYADDPRVRRGLGAASIAAGVALGIYTGILLSSLGARPLWSSGLLGPLFLVSGLSTGAAFAHLCSPVAAERAQLVRLDNVLIALELGLLALYLIGLGSASAAHATAARLLLGGPYTAVFWVGVVLLGLILPLAIQTLTAARRVAHTPIAPVLVLLGGLVLRFVLVFAGQASHWSPL